MTAYSSFGTLLKMGDGGSPESFTTIAEVLDIGGPELSLDTQETTNHSSTGGWEEVIGTILRSGEITLAVNYNPTHATHNAATGLIYAMVNRLKKNWQLAFPNPAVTTWSFVALVTKFSPQEPVAGALTAEVTLKLSGQPTLA